MKLKKIFESKAFIYAFILLIAAGILFFRSDFVIAKDAIVNAVIKNVGTELLVLAIVLVAFCKKESLTLVSLKVSGKSLLWSIPCFLVALANFPFSALINKTAVILRADLIWLVAIECFVVAVTEELFFRGVVTSHLDSKLEGKHKKFKVVIISGAIFGAWHIINLLGGAGVTATLLQVVYTFLIGSMLAMLLVTTKSLTLCVLVHAIFNFGGAVIEKLGTGVAHDTLFWIATVLAGVFCFVFMGVSYLKTEKPFKKTAVTALDDPNEDTK